MRRRSFVVTAGATALAARNASGANDRVRTAVIGVRSRGRELVDLLAGASSAEVSAVCDIDDGYAERASALAAKVQGSAPKSYRDIRRLLDDKDIDAVAISTCNHWHALATIWACQAGKDVYVEKPASHNIWEGRRMVEAASRYNRVVQVGLQSRSIAHKRRAVELLRSGAIGDLYLAKGLCYKRRKPIGVAPTASAPAGVDYDLWLGPAPQRPFQANRFHYNWHWFWDTGNGDIGNQGAHEMDLCRWGLGKTGLPVSVFSSGGKFGANDDQETPNTQTALFDYGDSQIQFEVRGLLTGGESSVSWDGNNFIGNLFFGTEGFLSVDSQGFQLYLGEKRELAQSMKAAEPRIWDTLPHLENFLDAVRGRKTAGLAAGIEDGHLSAALCHLANISYRVGRQLVFDPANENFGGDYEANQLLARDYRKPFVIPS
ncbi:MAG: Gfo/Idh/MocA family oxidoreductase [Bryobacteraceae bacterium]